MQKSKVYEIGKSVENWPSVEKMAGKFGTETCVMKQVQRKLKTRSNDTEPFIYKIKVSKHC
jgi:hypothetical protein